ncbi:MAG: glutamine--fructose-6-phosphate transaminase (isomerizing) [Tannerellaceae bacterium]|jgi:glucosamine--fructose-6-phosphate aminotransferase (isomerizing)|nr:glutamine--fructose-6-phosphate transaminase (isomerizing) [Tannerellaceae bacterium]
MCGIVGYVGNREAYGILMRGLERLEYRGYDSAGIGLVGGGGELGVYKRQGRVSELSAFCKGKALSGSIGIGHTRWATHGEANEVNAHPHVSEGSELALVHNGIIENYAELKAGLLRLGCSFKSETDTEVLVQLIGYIQRSEGVELSRAVQSALGRVVGAYAIVVLEAGNKERLIAARKSSPLVIGVGEGEYFIGSDAGAIIEYTKKVIYPEDEEMVIVDRSSGVKIVTLSNEEHRHEIIEVAGSLGSMEKGVYGHYMLKEIYEQPERLRDCMRGRVDALAGRVVLSGVSEHADRFASARRILIMGCGTSWHAALIGEYLIEELCRIPVEVEYSSEFRYRNPVVYAEDIVIALSQSGETADTLAAIEKAKEAGAFVYGICNVVGSSIARKTDTGSYIHVGPEIGVASTKAFTAQVCVLAMMALSIGRAKGSIEGSRYARLVSELARIPEKIEKVLESNGYIEELSKEFKDAENFIYLGRGYNYPVALEGALKLKEISYIHAEGYPAAEMKHGPIALVDAAMPVVVIAPENGMYEKVVSNIQEIKARGGRIVAIVSERDREVEGMVDYVIKVPETAGCLEALVTAVPLQLLSYHIAIRKGRDVDMPRNLAKSVTVE